MKKHLLFLLSAALAFGSLRADSTAIDPNALSLLRRMSDSLAKARGFTCTERVIMEVPSVTGQFLTFVPEGRVALRRPDGLRARFLGDAPPFDLFYDGSTLSVVAPHAGVYSTAKAPSGLDAMIAGLRRETGVRLPAAPLLLSNPYEALAKDLQSAVIVGETKVDGVTCDHLAFRRPGVNWEIWIEAGPRALPRRLAATYTDRRNFPRSIVEFKDWNLHPWLPGSLFVFRKGPDAREVPFATVLKKADR
jgi:hypothetical protein